MPSASRIPRRGLIALVALALAAGACSGSTERARGSADVLRLGVFPTLTHGVALVGLGAGIFQRVLGPTRVDAKALDSGTQASIALASGGLDASFIGPWPAASLYLRSGQVAIVAGAARGGSSFVVRTSAGITSPADLRGGRIAVPNIGSSQGVAVRTWLHRHGLAATDEGGDVSIISLESAQLPQLFRLGRVDAAWVPEPYPTLLESEGLARRFAGGGSGETAALLVSSIYLKAHPDVVHRLLEAEVRTIQFMHDAPAMAQTVAAEQLTAEGAPPMPSDVIASAWDRVAFTWDVDPAGLMRTSKQAYALGLVPDPPGELRGIYRLDPLNDVLDDDGLPPVTDPAEVP